MVRYGDGMIDASADRNLPESSESSLRDAVARGDATVATIAPVLRHLLANDDSSMFGEEIIARVRGMIADLARQMLDQAATSAGEAEWREHDDSAVAALVGAIIEDRMLLGHAHALAIEWQLTERLHAQLAIDPVLPPLLQKLVASSDGELAALAMHLLASQARWRQTQRRMQLPLSELPGDLLHPALVAMRQAVGARSGDAEAAIRSSYDEGGTRIGLLSRLVTAAPDEGQATLRIAEAGAALFLSALGIAAHQPRDRVTLSTNESQHARLALSLRAAGLDAADVDAQFLALHPDATPPAGHSRIAVDRAAAILATAVDRIGE